MDGWWQAVLAIAVAVLLCVGLLAALAGRRRLLARDGAAFECSVRLRMSTPGAGWVLGMARYGEDQVEWFRFFSYSLRPRRRFVRGEVRVVETREPEPAEAGALYAGQQVLVLEERRGTQPVRSELAMGRDSLTGLLSWLEAAPPGGAGGARP